jgi:hypothetical protein
MRKVVFLNVFLNVFFLVDIEKLKLNIRRMRAFNEVVLEMSSPVWDFTWETWGFEK